MRIMDILKLTAGMATSMPDAHIITNITSLTGEKLYAL